MNRVACSYRTPVCRLHTETQRVTTLCDDAADVCSVEHKEQQAQDRAPGHAELNVRFNRFVAEVYDSLVSLEQVAYDRNQFSDMSWIPYKRSSRCSRMTSTAISPESTAD